MEERGDLLYIFVATRELDSQLCCIQPVALSALCSFWETPLRMKVKMANDVLELQNQF